MKQELAFNLLALSFENLIYVMINIEDIKARYRINPEPREVTETRELITDSFKDLLFIEDSHQYFVGDQELPPVSSVCHKFEPYVDWDKIAENKAIKLGKTKETLQKEWHENNITSTSCGSKTHWFGEQMMNLFIGRDVDLPFQYSRDGYMIPYCGKEKAIEKYWTDILGNKDVYPVMPEAKLYNLDLGYAGTFDILLAYRMGNQIAFSIHDYKGLPLDTKIWTKGGWKIMGTVEVGDVVRDKEGEEVTVLNTSEIHYNPCYLITFNNGTSIVADHEHRWLVRTTLKENAFIAETDYRVMTTEDILERLGKIPMYIEQKNPQSFLKIVGVESTETIHTRCIEVSGPSHTFLVGENMLVTHNTNKDLKNDFNRAKSNRLLQPFQDFIDEPLSIYSIQLSLYQLGLEQLGIHVVDRNLIWLKDDGSYEKIGTPDLTQRLLNTL
jgi:hypothetical protein